MAADYDEATLLAMMMDDIGIERRNAIVTAWDENDREITTDVARQEEAALQSRRRPLEHANPQALQAWNEFKSHDPHMDEAARAAGLTAGGITHRLNRDTTSDTFEVLRPMRPMRPHVGGSQFNYGQASLSRVPIPAGTAIARPQSAPPATAPMTAATASGPRRGDKKSTPAASSKAPVTAPSGPPPARPLPPVPPFTVAGAALRGGPVIPRGIRPIRQPIFNPASALVSPQEFMAAIRQDNTTRGPATTPAAAAAVADIKETVKPASKLVEATQVSNKATDTAAVASKTGLLGSKWAPGGEYAQAPKTTKAATKPEPATKPQPTSTPAVVLPAPTVPATTTQAATTQAATTQAVITQSVVNSGLGQSKWAPLSARQPPRQPPRQPAPIVVVPCTEDPIAVSGNERVTEITTSPAAVEHHPASPPVAKLDVRAALNNSKFARPATERAVPTPSPSSTGPIRNAGHYIERFAPYQRARSYRSRLIPLEHAQWMARRGERRMNSDVMRGYPLLRDALLQPSKASEADDIIKMLRH